MMFKYGRYASLRPVLIRDFSVLMRWANSPNHQHFLSANLPPKFHMDLVADVNQFLRSQQLQILMIESQSDGTIGYVCFSQLDSRALRGHLEIFIASGTVWPIAAEAWLLALDLVFDWYPMEYVTTMPSKASEELKLLERLGFTYTTREEHQDKASLSRLAWSEARKQLTENLIIQQQFEAHSEHELGDKSPKPDASPIALKEFQPDDLDNMFVWYGDTYLPHYWNRRRRWLTFYDFVNFILEMRRASEMRLFVGHDESPLGYVQLYGAVPSTKTAFLTIYLSSQARSLQVTEEALTLSTRWALESAPLRKIYYEAFSFEEHTLEALITAGFVDEATTPSHYWYRDKYWPRIRMAYYSSNSQSLETGENSLEGRDKCVELSYS